MKFSFADFKQISVSQIFHRIIRGLGEGWFVPDDPSNKDRIRLLMHNYNLNIIGSLTGGSLYTGLLLMMNADDGFFGILAMIPTIVSMLQLFAPILLERFHRRKKILLTLYSIQSALNILLLGLIPIFPIEQQAKLGIVAVVTTLVNVIGIFMNPGISAWHLQSLPVGTRNSFFSLLSMTTGILTAVVNLAASWIADMFKFHGLEYQGLLTLRLIASIVMLVNIISISRIKEHPYERSGSQFRFRDIFIKPFKEKQYLRTVLIMSLWGIAVTIPGSTSSIYMLDNLDISYTYITLVSSMNIPIVIIVTPIWTKILNKAGHFNMLAIAASLYLTNYILQAFVTQETTWLYVVAMFIVCAVGAAINLINAGITYVNLPKENQTVHLSFYATVTGISGLIGTAIGRQFILATENRSITLLGVEMINRQYILLFTAAMVALVTLCIFLLQKPWRKKEAL